MKVAILTFHDTTNYGAILQTYALQQKIKNNGHECEILDYKCQAIEERYKIKKIKDCKNIKNFIKILLTNKNKKIVKEKFIEFTNKYLLMSDKIYNKSNIRSANKIYDSFIVGSDQVWNLDLTKGDLTYFLDFVDDNTKKNSYAASIGKESVSDKEKNIFKKFLKSFNEINVRENQGAVILKSIIDTNVNVTLDPTLLIDKKEWKKFISKEIKKDYILLYVIAPNERIIEFTKKLAKKEKLEIIYLNQSYFNILGMKNIRNSTPNEFLEYIYHAKYVVTTSFHGLAFSINFEKQFYYALSNEKNNYNSRIENLVEIFELKDRNIDSYSENNDIDYKLVNDILIKKRNESINILDNMLN